MRRSLRRARQREPVTLNDGIPPITNQYLFQPIAGAFYAPCVDGDMDTSVFGHEYTHLISNRMVGGPDAGLSGDQAGAMGESWSDLDALEYQDGVQLRADGARTRASLGAYATGNKTVGIRDYAVNHNPLNYSDLGFDTPGAEPHADGEIWNGTNFDSPPGAGRQVQRDVPVGDRGAAEGVRGRQVRRPTQCPGNRRWIQIVYDAWLLDPAR